MKHHWWQALQHDVLLLNLDDFQDMDIILILKVNKLLLTTSNHASIMEEKTPKTLCYKTFTYLTTR